MPVYKPNPKHKPGVAGEGPPRWYPDRDSICPQDIDEAQAQALLAESIEGADNAHPNRKARYAIDAQGRFFKGYCEAIGLDGIEVWHGYPVRDNLVRRQVPARILRQFVRAGKLPQAQYKRLLGSAQ